ncbi:hypothetical protein C943_02308 [Mariniradius saccharolyticus AK6]|uniref:Uncharacterized protein n=1 Tax=Mariniradius saccharolyticus AK6 TaxID=1239962 RepID=M7Y1S1_9BACT|nr:hypothetical protein C943_02308 [Mariniradius saccharolyticus AK6]
MATQSTIRINPPRFLVKTQFLQLTKSPPKTKTSPIPVSPGFGAQGKP